MIKTTTVFVVFQQNVEPLVSSHWVRLTFISTAGSDTQSGLATHLDTFQAESYQTLSFMTSFYHTAIAISTGEKFLFMMMNNVLSLHLVFCLKPFKRNAFRTRKRRRKQSVHHVPGSRQPIGFTVLFWFTKKQNIYLNWFLGSVLTQLPGHITDPSMSV